MDCPCPACTGKDSNFMREPEITEEVEAVELSAYDQLEDIVRRMKKTKTPMGSFIRELEGVQIALGEIDDQVVQLQKDCVRRPIDLTQFQLGEISKKLY